MAQLFQPAPRFSTFGARWMNAKRQSASGAGFRLVLGRRKEEPAAFTGKTLLEQFSHLTGLPLDQVCGISALWIAGTIFQTPFCYVGSRSALVRGLHGSADLGPPRAGPCFQERPFQNVAGTLAKSPALLCRANRETGGLHGPAVPPRILQWVGAVLF